MKTMNSGKLIGTVVFAAAGAIVIANWTQRNIIGASALVRPAMAAESARVIEIKAKKFAFTPGEITLKKGEPVILRLSTEDRTHGFLLKPYRIDTDITPGKFTDVPLTPTSGGQYLVICDHYCGTGHGNMKLKVNVVE
jgi:cytochrome c oxidase subunit 2